jgi:hypothetical protein
MGKLVACKGCGAEISRAAPACPKCGHPGPGPSRRYGCGTLLLLLVLAFLAFAVLSPHQPRPASPQASAPPTAPAMPLNDPGPAVTFLVEHPEFGRPGEIRPVPDWAKGPRWRSTGPDGREYLLYGKAGKVVTVYDVTPNDGRDVVWGETERD